MTKTTLNISGMHCASCARIIDNELTKLSGVTKSEVNYATEKVSVDFDEQRISILEMNNQVKKFGYSLIDNSGKTQESPDPLPDQKTLDLEEQKNKMLFVLPIALLIFFLMMWDIAAKLFISIPNLPIPMDMFNIISMILATLIIFWIGQPFLHGIVSFIRFGNANMDTLIGIGTLTAFIYSAIITLFPNLKTLLRLSDYTYFDVTIVVIGFVYLGKYLEARSKVKTGQAILKLIGLQAKFATVLRDNKEIEIAIRDVKVNDIIIIKPGTKIPVDGKIISGQSSIDESLVTGESIPVDKGVGDLVISGTINKQGAFKFVALKVGNDTMLSQIIKMVEEAQGSRAPIQKVADRISAVFVPTVLMLALASLLVWLSVGTYFIGFSSALSFGIMALVGILVIACPCALGLATPTAIIVGVGKGAEKGILIKNAEALEKLSSIDTIVFDKTGTITKGVPVVSDVIVIDKTLGEHDIIGYAASIEKLSEHPLAQAIVQKATEKNISLVEIRNFEALLGVGVKGMVDNKNIQVRKPRNGENNLEELTNLENQGKTVVIIEIENKIIGLLALSDTIKDEAIEAIRRLHKNNIKTIMLTGDNYAVAKYIAGLANIDEVIAGVLPHEKAEKIKSLQASGKRVAMIGDGVNDAPALVQANVGIAMATGTDVAIESADITLLKGNILKVSEAISLSKMTMRVIKQNLFWAFIYNVIGIPLAAGALYPFFGFFLNPVFAGLAMAFSSVSVISNSLRLKIKKL